MLFHVHARGLIHTKGKAVEKVGDLAGLRLRAPSRPVGDALAKFGAVPVFMPVPQTPEALSKNVIDGAVVPWDVPVSLRLSELTIHHTQNPRPPRLDTSPFLPALDTTHQDSQHARPTKE